MAAEIKSQKVMVVGGCGYFGYRIVRWLVEETRMVSSKVVVVDAVQPSAERRVVNVQYHVADIADIESVKTAMNEIKPNVVVNTASPPHYIGDLKRFMLINVDGNRNLLDAAMAQASVNIFIYISSSSVTHDTVSDLIEATENDPLVFMPKQRQVYSHSKAVAEQLVLSYNRRRPDLLVTAIRPSILFGPGERATVNAQIERARKGSLRFQVGDGKNLMDFTYVDNTVTAVVLTIDALLKVLHGHEVTEDMRVEGEAFVITNDEHRTFWGFFRDLGSEAGFPTDPDRIIAIPKAVGISMASLAEWIVWLFSFGTKRSSLRKADITYSTIIRTFNISKAKQRLGYSPRFSLDEGIKLSVAHFLAEQKQLEDRKGK